MRLALRADFEHAFTAEEQHGAERCGQCYFIPFKFACIAY
jgi:hypothetical protein